MFELQLAVSTVAGGTGSWSTGVRNCFKSQNEMVPQSMLNIIGKQTPKDVLCIVELKTNESNSLSLICIFRNVNTAPCLVFQKKMARTTKTQGKTVNKSASDRIMSRPRFMVLFKGLANQFI